MTTDLLPTRVVDGVSLDFTRTSESEFIRSSPQTKSKPYYQQSLP